MPNHDEIVDPLYKVSSAEGAKKTVSVAEEVLKNSPKDESSLLALADIYHAAGNLCEAVSLIKGVFNYRSSDSIAIKYCDFLRDSGKFYVAEFILKKLIRSGRDNFKVRLAELYRESRNWVALRELILNIDAYHDDFYLIYLLGRAAVSLLLEEEVIACADRLWGLPSPGPAHAQLLMDVWRYRIGDVEESPPIRPCEQFFYWPERDAVAIQNAPVSPLPKDTTIKSNAGWRSLRPRENMPNLLGIGTQRSATTWLWYHMSQRPEVQYISFKEPIYFSDAFESSSDLFRNLCLKDEISDAAYWSGPTRNLFRYLRLYGSGYPVRADFSPSYFELPDETVKVIRDILGADTKILLSVRDPVERSWSNLLYDAKIAGINVNALTFEDRASHYLSDSSLRRSDYSTVFRRWSAYFSKIKIVLYDDVLRRPKETLTDVYRFCDIDFTFKSISQKNELENRLNKGLKNVIPQKDRYFLLGLHEKHYNDCEEVLGIDVSNWRDKNLFHRR